MFVWFFFYHRPTLKSGYTALTPSLTMKEEANSRNPNMDFTESLTELLRPDRYFQSYRIYIYSSDRDSRETLQALNEQTPSSCDEK